MRIHGEVNITRRTEVDQESDYHKYEGVLSEDFGHICGYCGKSEMVTRKGFEIDHFVPMRIASERKPIIRTWFTAAVKNGTHWIIDYIN